jgi:hypothetical protein
MRGLSGLSGLSLARTTTFRELHWHTKAHAAQVAQAENAEVKPVKPVKPGFEAYQAWLQQRVDNIGCTLQHAAPRSDS